jgi:hypothetical protein
VFTFSGGSFRSVKAQTMSKRPAWLVLKLFFIFIMAVIGGLVGLGLSRELRPNPAALPLPHHIAKHPGGVSLRLAMVHDVIHERFPLHGPAYYEERNRRARESLPKEEAKVAEGAIQPESYWNLIDDLAVGLARQRQYAEAVTIMRDKLARQVALTLTGKDLYSSYANLGTFLILWQLDEGFADKVKAKERIRESIHLVHESIRVKPDAHFGREIWQEVLEEFLLASLDNPQLLLEFDMIGDRLNAPVDPREPRVLTDAIEWGRGQSQFAQWFLEKPESETGDRASLRMRFRAAIKQVGAEEGWASAVKTSQTAAAPFDEPTLGIIGMWRYGAGANPHFALALGEIMLRVGQRYIAWCAYERAVLVSEGMGPGEIRTGFVRHCRERQQLIEEQLPPAEVARLRPRFQQELAFGQAYQQAYQKYEEDRIRAGASLDDPTFYDAFHAKHGPIASPVGEEDRFVTTREGLERVSVPLVVFLAGLSAFITGLLLRIGSRRGKGSRQ